MSADLAKLRALVVGREEPFPLTTLEAALILEMPISEIRKRFASQIQNGGRSYVSSHEVKVALAAQMAPQEPGPGPGPSRGAASLSLRTTDAYLRKLPMTPQPKLAPPPPPPEPTPPPPPRFCRSCGVEIFKPRLRYCSRPCELMTLNNRRLAREAREAAKAEQPNEAHP